MIFPLFDERPGENILMAGASGLGKTIIALQTAKNAINRGKKVVYVLTDESVDELKEEAKMINFTTDFEKMTLVDCYSEILHAERLRVDTIINKCSKAQEILDSSTVFIIDSLTGLIISLSRHILEDYLVSRNVRELLMHLLDLLELPAYMKLVTLNTKLTDSQIKDYLTGEFDVLVELKEVGALFKAEISREGKIEKVLTYKISGGGIEVIGKD